MKNKLRVFEVWYCKVCDKLYTETDDEVCDECNYPLKETKVVFLDAVMEIKERLKVWKERD